MPHSPRPSVHKGSESVDDYLKAIFALGGAEGRRVGSTALAERLNVAPASITNMLQKLAAAENPLVEYERHRGVRLSAAGRRRALEIVRHHRLIETFLHRMLDYKVDELHDEAERLEHAVSPDFEAKLLARLGRGGACPHGNLSELESPSSRRHRGLVLLAEAQIGKDYVVSGIYERDRQLLEFLETRAIRPGAKLRVAGRNYDQTLNLSTAAGNIALGGAAADKVWVVPESRARRT